MKTLTAAILLLLFSVQLANSQVVLEDLNLVELTADSFYQVVHDIEKHVIVELYSSESWCMHCRTLHPIYRKIAKSYANDKSLVFARMDLAKNKPFDLKVIGYPSIKAFRRGNEEVDYWGANEEGLIVQFIEDSVIRNVSEL